MNGSTRHDGRMPSEEDNEVLPHGWMKTTLREIRLDRSKTFDPRKLADEMFELYSVPSFSAGRPEIMLGGTIGSSKRRVQTNSVLVCKINPRINRVWIVGDFSEYKKIASTEWLCFSEVSGLIPNFLCFYLQQDVFRDFLASNASGVGGSLMRVNNNTLANYPFVLPPLAEQRRIVAEIEKQFTRLDAAETALRRVKANLKRYRASVLKAACEGELVPTEAELAEAEGRDYEHAEQLLERILAERRARWESQEKRRGKYKEPAAPDISGLPELQKGWVWASLSSVGEVRLGRQRSPKRATGPNMRPYLRAANVTWDGLDLSDVKEMDFSPNEFETYRLIPGDIVLNEASGSPDEVGKPAIWNGQIYGCCFQNTLIRIRTIPRIVPFLFYRLMSDARSGNLGRAARGVGIHHLGAERTASWTIALPPLEEQHRIVAEIEQRLSIIQHAESTVAASLRRVEQLRQSILKRAFCGQLVPQDPDDEPASVLLESIHAEREAAQAAAASGGRKTRRRRSKAASDKQIRLLENGP